MLGTDNVAVTKIDLYIDGKWFATSSTSPATFSWSTRKVTRGAHTLQSYAYDAAGNVGVPPKITVFGAERDPGWVSCGFVSFPHGSPGEPVSMDAEKYVF